VSQQEFADTGFANEDNMQYLNKNKINAYISDNQFRSRDPKFVNQKNKYGKHKRNSKKKAKEVIPASEFRFDPTEKTCVCPAGESMQLNKEGNDQRGIYNVFFHCKPTLCRNCELKKNACEILHQPIQEQVTLGRCHLF